MSSIPPGLQSLKRLHTGIQEDRNPKRLCLDALSSIPQFIEEMNALLRMNICNQEKEALLSNKILCFHASEKIPTLIHNPFFGMQITQIVQSCLQLAPINNVFKSMLGFAETLYLPHDLIQKIFSMLFVSQSWDEMLKLKLDADQKVAPRVLNSIGLVSKKWRESLFRVFAPKMSWKQLRRLKIFKEEELIKLAEICKGQFSRLDLVDNKTQDTISLSRKELSRLLPLISNIKKFEVSSSIHSTCFSMIVNSSHMNNLKSFSLHDGTNRLHPQAWLSFEQTTQLKNLTTLDLKNIRLNFEGLNSILRAHCLSQVKYLNLSQNPIRDGLVKCKIKPNFANLEELDLSCCKLKRLGELVRFEMPKLRTLDLSFNPIKTKQLIKLKDSQLSNSVEQLIISIKETPKEVEALLLAFPKLRSLEINSEMIDVDGVAVILADHSGVQQLNSLDLGSLPIPEDEIIYLLNSKFLTNLKDLTFVNSLIGPLGVSAFEKALFQLDYLSLCEAHFVENGDAMSILTTAPSTSQLKELSLEGCILNHEAQEALVRASGLEKLEVLNLVETDFSEESLILLSENTHFENLKSLVVNNNAIGPETLIQVAKSKFLKNLERITFDFDQDFDPELAKSVKLEIKKILAQKKLWQSATVPEEK